MKVVVLMGGYGTRMRPHSWSRPKPVMQVADNTVIGHILDRFAEVATEEVILVVGYKGEQIEAWVREHYAHLDLRFVYQHEPLGQAHALWLCRELLDGGDVVGDPVVAQVAEFRARPAHNLHHPANPIGAVLHAGEKAKRPPGERGGVIGGAVRCFHSHPPFKGASRAGCADAP